MTTRLRGMLALIPSLALPFALLAVPAPAAQAATPADITAGLALHYRLDETSGAVATDSSGNGRNGTVLGAAAWSPGQGLAFNGTDTYVKAPDNLLRGMDAVTVSTDVLIAPEQATPYFVYGFGNTASGVGNGYLFTTGNGYRTSIASGNWSTEQTTKPTTGFNLQRGVWKHLTYTQAGTTGVLYEDGVEVARNTAVTLTPGSIGAGTTTADYLGRSVYSADRYLNGRMRDFRIYDRALTSSEVGVLAQPVTTTSVDQDTAALTLGDTTAVTADLALPATGAAGARIAWATDNPATVTSTGKVTRPAAGQPSARATLTATISRGTVSGTKQFDVTVLPDFNDQDATAHAAEELTVRGLGDVRGNLTLPGTAAYGTTVAWTSDRPELVSGDGVVHRPAPGSGAATVTLTATVSRGTATTQRAFPATLPELPAQQPYKGYAFSYFTGEGTADGEQIYLALSQGNDALHWQELNGGKPVLTSTLGTKGLRDPFIIRSPEGDKFYQIATDLRIYGYGNWDGSQRTGSKSIMVWESTDLVNWTDQRLVQVSPDTAGNTWAPEAYYDKTIGAYVVFWASKIYAENDPDHTGSTYNKMLYATTRDFVTFSEPQVWVDPGYSVIDSTMIEHDGQYYRFTKDERNNTSTTPCSKFIIEQKSAELRSQNYDFVADCIGKGSISQGEGPLVFKSNTEEKWYLFVDEFGGRGYIPFETTDLASGKWTLSTNYSLPSRPRHGTVLPVTQAEYDRMLAAYGTPVTGLSISPATLRTAVGVSRTLTPTVTPAGATFGTLTWHSDNPSVATVSSSGVVTTVAAGTARITVTTSDGAKSAVATVEATTAIDPALLLQYDFDETSGSVAADSSGRGNDGSYARTPAFGTGVHGGSFKMSGGGNTSTTAPYVTIPGGVLNGLSAVTVATWVKRDSSTARNQWLFGLGPDSNKYLFAAAANGSGALSAALTNGSWQAESTMAPGTTLPAGSWRHVTVTVDSASQTAVLYVDGLVAARATGITVKPSDLHDATKNYSGYVGRSLYAADPYFGGEVDDFRIYGRALAADEVLQLSGNTTAVTAANVDGLKVPAIVDADHNRIVLPLNEGAQLTSLAPSLTLAPGAVSSPASGTTRDFSTPQTYTVTGSDGTQRVWTVQALVMRSPVLPGLTADPQLAVFGGTFYLYPTTDGFPGWSGTQFKAYSSTDLVHWQDHGVVLDLGPDVSWADSRAWAPGVAERNGKYYLYFCAEQQIGVAVADSPTGPFKDALGRPLVAAGQFSGQMIDPSVFTDDDGASYLYWGNGSAYGVRLNDDMVSFDAAQVKSFTPDGFREGAYTVKRDGTYYFMWSEDDTRSENYRVAYATGSSPLGPWTKQGVILSKDLSLGIKGTGHHSVVRVPGTDDWYVAYHRFALPGGDGTHRETTIDRLEFAPDGTIKPVVPTLESIDPVSVAQAGPPVSGTEGAAIALSGKVTGAPVGAEWTYHSTSGATCSFSDADAAATQVSCTDDGVYEVTLTAGRSRSTTTVTVSNSAPVAGTPSGPSTPAAIGTPVTLTVPVTDPGAGDTHTCTVDWQDGTTSVGVCTATHTYRKAGLYRPSVTVTDDDGATATVRPGTDLVTYDPAGSLTATGQLDRSGPPVTVDLALRYPKRAVTPDGTVTVRLDGGTRQFRSTHHEWLVAADGRAVYQGSGTINGTGNYGIRITATPDRIQLTIWDRTTGRPVFTNGTDGTALRGLIAVRPQTA